jgi:hypothetical protein
MEIKVTCGCGTKYKFDVEPVNKRMPWPVNCPSCGADGTAQANELIRQNLATSEPAAVPVAVPIPVAAPLPPPSGLRISTTPTPPTLAGVQAPPPFAPPPIRPTQGYAQQAQSAQKSASSKWARIGSILLVVLVASLIGFRFFRRVSRLVSVVQAIVKVTGDSADTDDRKWNLGADNQVIIYLKHTNNQEVADACCTYFYKQLNRNVRRKTPDQANSDGHEFMVMSPYNDYVEFMCDVTSLKEPEFTGLAEHLSAKFQTLVFVEQDVDATGSSVFGVYEQGTNQFFAHMDVSTSSGEPVEVATTQGDDWALAHGYKPGKNGFKDFNIENADDLTKRCGMKIWKHNDDEPTPKDIVLKEWGGRN